MKHLAWLGLLVGVAVLLFGVSAGSSADKNKSGGVAPLSLEGFLDEKLPEAKTKGDVILADNQSCLVCHDNYEQEPLALVHAKGDVGCIECHGKSLDHRNDEDNIIPPDKMFPHAAVNKMCKECHETHDAPAQEVIARWQQRCPQKNSKNIICTDCHGKHRLSARTVEWNKTTGKLIPRKK